MCPPQAFLPAPVASLKDVAEKSASGVIPSQGTFGYSASIGKRDFGCCIHQLGYNDATGTAVPSAATCASEIRGPVLFNLSQPSQRFYQAAEEWV